MTVSSVLPTGTSATAATASPASDVGFGPSRLMMRAVIPVDMTATMSVCGRNARPVATAL